MSFEDMHRPLSRAGFRGATRAIVVISGVMLLLQAFIPGPLIYWLGLTPTRVLQDHCWWQLVTYLFLHGGVFHWLFNMLVLWMFGRELEVRWGTAYFLRYFFVTGIGAALLVLLLSPHSSAPTIGSSGAIFGLLVAFAMVFPEAVIYLYFLIPVKAWQAAALFAFIEFFAGMEAGGSGIARFAHLGGMLTGYLYLRWGWYASNRFGRPFQGLLQRIGRWRVPKTRTSPQLYEVTDELVREVDQILEKILKQGADSLTPHEKKIMERYSRMKH